MGRFLCTCLLGLLLLASLSAPASAKMDPAVKKLATASGLFQSGLHKLAAEAYREFLQTYPTHKQASLARYGLAVSEYRLGKYQAALAPLEAVIRDKSFPQRDEALAVLGHCQLALKQYPQAVKTFDTLRHDNPTSRHAELATLNRMQAIYMQNQPDQARKAADEFLKKYPASTSASIARYFLALSLRDLKKPAEAIAPLQTLAADTKNPNRLDAMLLLGRCLQQTGKTKDALTQYERAVQAAPATRKLDAQVALASALYQAESFDRAIETYNAILRADTKKPARYPAARYQLGLAQWAAKKIDDARKNFHLASKDSTDAARQKQALYWLARCELANGKYADARSALQSLRNQNPANPERVAYDLALCTMAMGKYQDAAKEFGAYVQQFKKTAPGPRRLDAMYRQAFCLHKQKQYTQSETLCQAILQSGESRVRIATLELSAENLFLTSKYKAAEAAFATLQKQLPKNEEARQLELAFRVGQCAFYRGNAARAIETLTPLTKNPKTASRPELHEAFLVLGDAQLQKKQYPAAAASLARYLQISKENLVEARYKHGVALLRAGDNNAAMREFQTLANQQKSESTWGQRARFELGQLLYKAKRMDEARQTLTRVRNNKSAPADLAGPAMYLLAWIDLDAKKYEPAARGFDEFISKHGKHELAADAKFQRALCLQLAGKNEQALAAYRTYLNEHPTGPNATQARQLSARCLAKADKHSDAKSLLIKLAKDPKTCTHTVLYELAWAHRETKQTDDAIAAYRRILKEYPQSDRATAAKAELADMLYLQKDYAQAIVMSKAVLAASDAAPDAKAASQYRLGWCYAKCDKPVEAANAFAAYAKAYPNDKATPSALYQAGAAYLELGKTNEGIALFETLVQRVPKHDLTRQTRIRLGQAYAANQQMDKSANAYRTFLQAHPKDELAYLANFGLGWAAESKKRYDEARSYYTKVANAHDGPTAARSQFQIGETYFAEGKFEKAAAALIAVDAVYGYPEWSARALYEAGRALEAAKNPAAAKIQYQRCLRKHPTTKEGTLAKKRLTTLGE